ncbi:uncharacterized protein Z520_06519 [Fonsecaea multimorphosa CBS 102226]|uniref:Uncharacterized protein n=1 Tax=Fonsecaea multimorphosa CBS 102226 TaxID=1442371 RepID=A0A0D2IL48_9EURO|nr:uncharacterized protein Z520_06519 [Fonsecaea multimorphosa CBS 102226]KIX97741.1 hypothetical protein Z520_06519 [Fonsecaea multimorphosa CBS 102226]
MAQPLSTQHAAALCAGVDAVISHLLNTLEHDFSLQHPRLAYIAGVNAYLEKMLDVDLQDDIERVQFENALRLCLPRSPQGEPYSMIIKRQFLLAGLSSDILLYNAHWAQQYQARNLADPAPTASLGIMSTKSSIPETRNALMSYRQRVYAEATRDASEGEERHHFVTGQEMVMQTDVCINKWIEFVEASGGNAWEDTAGVNEDVDNDQEEGTEHTNNSANSDVDDEDVASQDRNWERRANGRYHCTICVSHGGIVHWSSLKRHMAEKHGLDM